MPLVNDIWYGPEKIILAIDIGTTYSAVSYSYLYPGWIYHWSRASNTYVMDVTGGPSNWPDQRKPAGDPKIPTLIWYDKRKKVRGFNPGTILVILKCPLAGKARHLSTRCKCPGSDGK
jgi:hypothetical protein